jgi:hypothetical protein
MGILFSGIYKKKIVWLIILIIMFPGVIIRKSGYVGSYFNFITIFMGIFYEKMGYALTV